MVLSELRANAWKAASGVLAVLAVAALLAALVFRGSATLSDARAQMAEQEADYQRAQVDSLSKARARDAKAEELGQKAEGQVAQHTAQSNERLNQIEVRYRDRIVQVPATCPAPDAQLMQDLAEQTGRISAAANRLRGISGSGQEASR